jgi:hypothetical protein
MARTSFKLPMWVFYVPSFNPVAETLQSTVKLGNSVSMDTGGSSYRFMVDDDFPRDITVLEGFSATYDENMKRTETKDGVRITSHNLPNQCLLTVTLVP